MGEAVPARKHPSTSDGVGQVVAEGGEGRAEVGAAAEETAAAPGTATEPASGRATATINQYDTQTHSHRLVISQALRISNDHL